MLKNVILVADASRLDTAAATPLLERVRAIGRQPPILTVLALGEGGGVLVPGTPSQDVKALRWPRDLGPVGAGDVRLVLDTVHELLAVTGNDTLQLVLMTSDQVSDELRGAVAPLAGIDVVDGAELGVRAGESASRHQASDLRSRRFTARSERRPANPNVMVRLFAYERYGRDSDDFRVPGHFRMVSGQEGRVPDEEQALWQAGRRPLQREEIVGRRFLKVSDSGHAFVVQLAADGSLHERPLFACEPGWDGSWELVDGFLDLTVGPYVLTIVGARDGLHSGLEGDTAFLLVPLSDAAPRVGTGRWLKVTTAGNAFVLDMAGDGSLVERRPFHGSDIWTGGWKRPSVKDRVWGRSLGRITIDLYVTNVRAGTIPGTLLGDDRHPDDTGCTFSLVLVPLPAAGPAPPDCRN